MTLAFSTARSTDAEALAAFVNSAYRGESSRAGWTTEEHLLGGQRTDAESLRELIARDVILLGRGEDGGLAASAHLQREGARGWIGMLTVKPTLQNAGLGRQLIAAAEAYLRDEWHCRTAAMTVISVRDELIAYYVRRGFRPNGERKDFPFGDPRFGDAKRRDFHLAVLEKPL